MYPKDADIMANSVDPDQNAEIWVYTVCCSGLFAPKLRNITTWRKLKSDNALVEDANHSIHLLFCGNYFSVPLNNWKMRQAVGEPWWLNVTLMIYGSEDRYVMWKYEVVQAGTQLWNLSDICLKFVLNFRAGVLFLLKVVLWFWEWKDRKKLRKGLKEKL